jgi:T4 beta protein
MNVTSFTYVPALKWRQAEYQALLRLSDAAKSKIVPFIMIPPIEFDFEEGEPKKTTQEHLQAFPKRYKDKWNARPAWIDIDVQLHAGTMDNGVDVLTHVFSELRKFDARAVPVSSLDYKPSVINALAKIATKDKRGVALRARLEHIMLADFGKRAANHLQQLKVTFADVDLIVDLGAPSYEPYVAFSGALVAALSKIPQLHDFRSFVLIGTAYPGSMQDISIPGASVERHDWLFYKKLTASLPKSMRRPAFGDFTTVNPAFIANFDMRFVKPAGKLVYTTKDQWAIRKGGSFRDNPKQMHSHCAHIVGSGLFRGASYSNGDDYIARCARKEKDAGPSTLTRWKEIGISHHIMHVLEDLASLGD